VICKYRLQFAGMIQDRQEAIVRRGDREAPAICELT
jgi:hypothetical protein